MTTVAPGPEPSGSYSPSLEITPAKPARGAGVRVNKSTDSATPRAIRGQLIRIARQRALGVERDSEQELFWLNLAAGLCRCGWAQLYRNRRTGTVVGLPDHCDRPLCPYCEWRRIARVRDRYRARHDEALADRRLFFAVLTIPNVPLGTLGATLARLRAAITRLRRQRWFADLVAGGLWRLELTVNLDARGWHPHVNLVIETRRRTSMRWLQPQLQAAWRQALGETEQQWVWLYPGWAGTLPEAIKRQVAPHGGSSDAEWKRDSATSLDYAAKPPISSWIAEDDPAWVVEYIESQRGRRQVASFGNWRRLPKPRQEHVGELLVEAPAASEDPWWVTRQLPQFDPTMPIAGQLPADWESAGRGPRYALRPVTPPDGGGQWLVWRPGDGPAPDELDDDLLSETDGWAFAGRSP